MPTPPHDEDRAFLRAILEDPADLTAWLVYADWLDEHDDPRGEYVRLEVRRGELPETDPERLTIRARLEELRPAFDPEWLAVFDRPPIENCTCADNFRCPRLWQCLEATDCLGVRHCGVCDRAVHYCHDLDSAREHVKLGDRVAVRSGLPRTATDLMDDAEAEAWEALLSDPRIKTHPDLPN
jgi:uncharacterized protein (TIGR02996 family)